MLIQASNFNLMQSGKRTEYVIMGRRVIYSMYGNEPKIKPKRSFFPKTKNDLEITRNFNCDSKCIRILPDVYGYHTFGLNSKKTPHIKMPLLNLFDYSEALHFGTATGYGYYTNNLDIAKTDDLNIRTFFNTTSNKIIF
jgi:hypothetical protein